ncbi:MAG: hypothetical protein RLZZ458_2960, partial [Planctomycetota bacterium]
MKTTTRVFAVGTLRKDLSRSFTKDLFAA